MAKLKFVAKDNQDMFDFAGYQNKKKQKAILLKKTSHNMLKKKTCHYKLYIVAKER